LINEDGIVVTDIDVIKRPSLIYFGYTFCPDICPLDTYRNAEAVTLLEEDGYDVTPIFITFDPVRDTPEVLKQFTDYMHPKMVGLTGSIDEIKKVAKKYRVYFKKQNTDDSENYLVDHTAFTYLVLPEIGFVDFFRRELTAEQLAEKVSCFIK
jgi:protein SCO1/2